MKKIAFVLYRDWAYKIFEEVLSKVDKEKSSKIDFPLLITTPEHEFLLPKDGTFNVVVIQGKDQVSLAEVLQRHGINTVCFYGWSWIVKEPVLSDYTCLCLHPSPLPRYRGGSPIQHQLVSGETKSAVSIIKMSEGIDDGDIYTQIPILFTGYLPEILHEIVLAGALATNKYLEDLINDRVQFTPQKNIEKYPPLKRRTLKDGIIDVGIAVNEPYEKVFNLVRGLQKPYPWATITLADGILHVKKVYFLKEVSQDIVISSKDDHLTDRPLPYAIKVSDGYVLITDAEFSLTKFSKKNL